MTSTNWVWLDAAVVRAVHREQLAEHGGASGIRDEALLESAMARPKHAAQYDAPDAASLAPAYGFGIVRNHPFVDGNKRTAFVAVELFLALNGWSLEADDGDCVMVMLGVASGGLSADEFASWIRSHAIAA